MIELKVLNCDAGKRIDKIVSQRIDIKYSLLQKLFRLKKIEKNNQKAKAQDIACEEDIIVIHANLQVRQLKNETLSENESESLRQQFKNLCIYEDHNCFIINKPCGLAVQGGSKISLCVEDLLKAYANKDFKLVHRLDKNTSGLLIIAKSTEAARKLTSAFKNNNVRKKYIAITLGVPKQKSGIIRVYIKKTLISKEEKVVVVNKDDKDGLYSETSYNVIKCSKEMALVELYPVTGRTHQLRVHCAEIMKTPILGDKKYNKTAKKMKFMYLHAASIKIDELKIAVESCIPAYFEQEIKNMHDVHNQA